MRRVVVFLLVTAALVAFAWWLAYLPGTITATIGTIAVTLPVPWAVLGLLVLLAVVYLVIRFLAMIVRLPSRTRRIQSERARRNGGDAVTRTLLALAGGDAETARRQAQRSRNLLGDTPQTLLLAAYAGRLAGRTEDADAAFDLLAARKDAAFLGLRGRLQGAIARSDWASAGAIARQAEEANPGTPWLRAERARLAIRAGNWREAMALTGPDDPVAAIGLAAAEAENDPAEARRLAKQAWQADHSFAPAALAYARHLRDRGQDRKALAVLLATWTRAPHAAVAESYLATSPSPAATATRVEALAAAAPDFPETRLLRAQVALEQGQFAAARAHVDAARAAGLRQRRVWLLLAEIAEKAGDGPAASDALLQAATSEPDPQWRCDSCGTVHAAWHMVCDHCGATGRISWGEGSSGAPRLHLITSGDPILP